MAARRRSILLATLLGPFAAGLLVPAAGAEATFNDTWGYSYCNQPAGCVHASYGDPATGRIHLEASVSSTSTDDNPGSAGGVRELYGDTALAEPAGSVLVTAVLRLDQAEATGSGASTVRSKVLVSAAIDGCAGSGCMGSAETQLVGVGNGAPASRTGEVVTAQFRLMHQGGGNLPAGNVSYSVGVDGAALVDPDQNGSGGYAIDATVVSLTVEPGPLMQSVEVPVTAEYTGGGLYTGASTPTPCGEAPVEIGFVCIPVPADATHVRVSLDDALRDPVGGALRGNLAPGWTDQSFCGQSGTMQVHPGVGWVVVFPGGPNSCGPAVKGTVTAVFTVWQPAA